MAGRWRMFLEDAPWRNGKKLFIIFDQSPFGAVRGVVEPFSVRALASLNAMEADRPTLEESWEEGRDNMGDVTGFLQQALDLAWNIGMRPTGFADHTNELKATRYHLEDMRVLAGVKKDG